MKRVTRVEVVIVGVEVDFVGTEEEEEETGDMAGMTGCHFAALISTLQTFACLCRCTA